MFIISGWQITHSQPYGAAHNFDDFNQFSTLQHYAPFREIPENNRHFYHSLRPGQQQYFPSPQNFNQNYETAKKQNISKWVKGPLVFATTTSAPTSRPQSGLDNKQQSFPSHYNFNQNSVADNHSNPNKWVNGPLVFATTTPASSTKPQVILGKDIQTTVQFIPFATTPTPEFLECFIHCPTTSQYDPVCASNRQQYHNEQKFICAKRCGQGMLYLNLVPRTQQMARYSVRGICYVKFLNALFNCQ